MVEAPLFIGIATGLALFLFGMAQLEQGLKALGQRAFQGWLSRSTASPLGAVAVGTGVTALMQSSSLVSLLVLAFASAGVLPLANAVGVLLGANLGTTMTGWVVTTLGFKLSLQTLALPGMALGAVLQLLPLRDARWSGLGGVLFGIGLLLFGLDIMKATAAGIAEKWDIAALQGRSTIVYFLAGVALAAIIQSSSAVMMLTLTALHSGLLELLPAAALIIGADLGTTSTTLIGSIGGSAIKRQLALAHLLFNLVVDVFALFVLLPLLPPLLALAGLTDPLYSLVAFHSGFNLVGLCLFLPFIRPAARWLEARYDTTRTAPPSLASVPTKVPEAALTATERLLHEMRLQAVALTLHAFRLQVQQLVLPQALSAQLQACVNQPVNVEQRYALIKQWESELLAYSGDLQEQSLSPAQVDRLSRQVRQARSLAYSSKTLKDIREHLFTQRHSELDAVTALAGEHRDYVAAATGAYLRAAQRAVMPDYAEWLEEHMQRNDAHYEAGNRLVSDMAARDIVSGVELTNMLNVNRDIHHAIKDLLKSLEP